MRWSGPPVLDARRDQRLVVIAPHPDDEVLAAGGLMRWTTRRDREVVVIAVTDGEGSHTRSARITADALRDRRAGERDEALARLGVIDVTVHRLGHPDRSCGDHISAIADDIGAIVRPHDVVVGPSPRDRHPDHVAVAAAVRAAALDGVDTVWDAPTWSLVDGTAHPPTAVLELDDDAWVAKQHAAVAFRSQLEALGPEPDDGPVVHPHELVAMLTRREGFRAVHRATVRR